MHRGGREGGANYLQVVTKDTLEDQVGLSISVVRLASRGRIQLASLKEIFFLFQMQLSAKCLVIFQLTISILGVLRRQRIPLPTDPHTGTGVISGIGIARSGMRGIGGSNCSKSNNSSRAGGRIRSGPQVGKVATSPLPYRGSPPLQSGGQNQKWPTSGRSGYLTPAVSGIPTASERGAKSEVAHKWAKWLPHPCRIGDPHRFRAGGKIRSGPQVGEMATSPLPYRGSPPLQSGGQNQKWPTSGQSGYLTPAVSGIPTASERGAKSEVAHKWAKWLPHPCRIGDPHRFRAGGKIRKKGCFLLSFLLSKKKYFFSTQFFTE